MDDSVARDEVAQAHERLVAASGLRAGRHRVAGIDTAVLEGGSGPPMVLLHGQGELGAVWLRVLPTLARTHRLLVPDLPGHGRSGTGTRALDAGVLVDWLDGLLDVATRSGEPAVVAGHLLGGAIAARHAVVHGERIAHLVLVDTLGLVWFRPRLRFALPMMAFLARPTPTTRDRLFDQCFVDHDTVAAEHGEIWEDLATCALAGAQDPKLQRAMRTMMPKVGLPPIPDDDLDRIVAPTTLIHGRLDLQVPLAAARAASERFGWPLHVIDDVRDDPVAESPDAFLAALADVGGGVRSATTEHSGSVGP